MRSTRKVVQAKVLRTRTINDNRWVQQLRTSKNEWRDLHCKSAEMCVLEWYDSVFNVSLNKLQWVERYRVGPRNDIVVGLLRDADRLSTWWWLSSLSHIECYMELLPHRTRCVAISEQEVGIIFCVTMTDLGRIVLCSTFYHLWARANATTSSLSS